MRVRSTIFAALLIAACAPTQSSTVPSLQPEEVLSRAAKATHTLKSAQYVADGDFESVSGTQTTSGTFRMDGMLQEAGSQLRFQLDVDATIDDIEQPSSVSGTVEVVMISPAEVYMNVHSLTSQPSSAIFSPSVIGNIAGKWWSLPEGDTPPVVGTVSPDPRLLDAQAQVVEVTKDRGVEEMHGIPSYHYDVALNKQKLITYLSAVAHEKGVEFSAEETSKQLDAVEASGQLWIDAENFYIQKIMWVIQSLPTQTGTASVSIEITLRNHNKAPQILPPEEFSEFTPAVFLDLPEDALFPEERNEPSGYELDDAEIKNLMQQLNSF